MSSSKGSKASRSKKRQQDEVTNEEAEEELAREGTKERRLSVIQAHHDRLWQELRGVRAELLRAGKAPDSGEGSGVSAAFDPQEEIEETSKLTTYPVWKPYQFNALKQPRWRCYRGPKEAEPKVPLVLLHDSFEVFCKDVDRSRGVEELDDADFELAEMIWDTFTKGTENELTGVTLPLNRAFEIYLKTIVAYEIPGVCKTDGFVAYKMARGVAGMEDRQGADAMFQLLEYFRKAFRDNTTKLCRISHAIGVLRVLPSLQFVAVVMDWDSRKEVDPSGILMAEPLTDAINCWGPKNLGLAKVARALKAFKKFVKCYKPEPYIDVCIPFLLKEWTDLRHLKGELNQDALIFCGRDPASGETKVAKFCTTYSEAAHKAWANANLAPAVDKVTNLHSGWTCVVMEYLSEQDGWEAANGLIKRYIHNKAALKSLHTALKSFLDKGHATGFVHGDFRFANIFVREARDQTFELRAIDFDWAGPAGAARYPQQLNPSHAWHPEAGVGKFIRPQHDHVFIDGFALQKLVD